jgi:hypothetical protein
MEGRDLRANYEEDLNRLKTAQRNAAVADLENTRNQALSNLQAEQRQNAATYNTQRSSANAQNRLSARNFQEYLASTGRANSGLSAQARMQNANNLNTSLNNLNTGEAAAIADINRRTTDAQNAYNTGLAGANAQIEANYIQNLLNERDKQLQRDLQERQFQESIRQFNENLALQRQQLQSRFSSGSGGGGRTSSGGGSSKTTTTSSKQPTIAEQNAALRNAAKNGQVYVKYVQTSQGGVAEQLWKKSSNGKDTRVR